MYEGDKDWWKDYNTRSIFKDYNQVGTVERKYIIDILARPYPQGFTVTIGETQLRYNPLKNTGLEVHNTDNEGNVPELIWDHFRQQLIVVKWPIEGEIIHLTVEPGLSQNYLKR